MTFEIRFNLFVPTEQVAQVQDFTRNSLSKLKLDVDFPTSAETSFTNLTVAVSTSASKTIKNILKMIGAPDDEINKLSKIKSCVESALYQVIQPLVQQIQGARR